MANGEEDKGIQNKNPKLDKSLKTSEEEMEDLFAYRIYTKARNWFLWSVGFLLLVLTVFGLVSLNTTINEIKSRIEIESIAEFKGKITGIIKDDFENKYFEAMKEEIKQEYATKVILDISNALEIVKENAPESNKKGYEQAIKEINAGKKYKIIGGSNIKREILEKEINRIKKEQGERFATLFPNADIYLIEKKNKCYAIVLAGDLNYDTAVNLRDKAISLGFRRDTYITVDSISTSKSTQP